MEIRPLICALVALSSSAFGQTAALRVNVATSRIVDQTTVKIPSGMTLEVESGGTIKFSDLGFIADANGNEVLILDTVASAVNEITLANAATGNPPKLSATGGNTNIGMTLSTKGTGAFTLTTGITVGAGATLDMSSATNCRLALKATSNVGVSLYEGGTERWAFFSLNGDFGAYDVAAADAGFFIDHANRNFGIGTSLAAATEKLEVVGSIKISALTGKLIIPSTITGAGTTGAQTINKSSGSVNLAAAATSLVVTNSVVGTSSRVFLNIATNDANTFSVRAVPAAGSFTIQVKGTAPAAETRVDFFVVN